MSAPANSSGSAASPPSAANTAAMEGIPPHVQIVQMAIAIWMSRALYGAAKLKLADHLAAGPRSAAELAGPIGAHARSLHRLMRTLASRGLLTEVEPGRFALTPLGAALKSDAPGAARATVLTLAGDWQWKGWGEFLHSLKTGEPGVKKAWGMPIFEYLQRHPDDGRLFDDAMIGMHGPGVPAVAAAYDFSACKTVVDIGGGTGTLLSQILRTNQHLRGTLFDLPATAEAARTRIAASDVATRCEVAAGDFFKAVPSGFDAYVLSHILHDWNDDECVTILRSVRKAIPAHGKVLIVEIVLPPGDAPHHGKMIDMLMLTVTGGVERTEQEFAAILSAAGFRLARVLPTKIFQSIVEAVPV